MKALILGAGQGSRLLPLTEKRPKCLLPVAGQSMIEWQVRELARAGVEEFVVVVGFKASAVERELAKLTARHDVLVRAIYNPFYKVADNLGSCWLARDEMTEDFVLVNGDVVFESAIPRRVFSQASMPVTVTIDRRADYDADDMKIRLRGDKVLEIGKTVAVAKVDAESIGMHVFRGDGPGHFVEALDKAMRTRAGLECWYTQVIDGLAKNGVVGSVSIEGMSWGEVDYPADLDRVRRMASAWAGANGAAASAADATT